MAAPGVRIGGVIPRLRDEIVLSGRWRRPTHSAPHWPVSIAAPTPMASGRMGVTWGAAVFVQPGRSGISPGLLGAQRQSEFSALGQTGTLDTSISPAGLSDEDSPRPSHVHSSTYCHRCGANFMLGRRLPRRRLTIDQCWGSTGGKADNRTAPGAAKRRDIHFTPEEKIAPPW